MYELCINTGLGFGSALPETINNIKLSGFDGFFTSFHRIAFTNDGWLLDSRTDLLIRLMPTDFFMSLGAGLLLWVAAASVAAGAAAWIIRKRARKEVHHTA